METSPSSLSRLTPPPAALRARYDLARTAATAAGQVLMGFLGHHGVTHHKGAVDLVTAADEAAEALLRRELLALFPEDALLAEEGGAGGRAGAPWTWVVDPLDGTTNFVHGLHHFAVSVGILYEGVPVAGVIHAPAYARTWHGAVGRGVWLDDRPVQVAPTSELGEALLATGFPYDRRTKARALLGPVERALVAARGLRRMGSAALDLAHVASGHFGGFWEQGLKPWDMAAGVALVREAGGRVTDFDGAPWDPADGLIVATNGSLHAAVVAIAGARPGGA